MLALRELGADAWAEGYGDKLRYSVIVDGRKELIVAPTPSDADRPLEARDGALEEQVSEAVWSLLRSHDERTRLANAASREFSLLVEQVLKLATVEGARGASRAWRDVYVGRRGPSPVDAFIDIVYELEGFLHLIEFKAVPSDELSSASRIEPLKRQLVHYASLVEDTLQQDVRDATLVLLTPAEARSEVVTSFERPDGSPEDSDGAVLRLAG
jgi:hypothetical protein